MQKELLYDELEKSEETGVIYEFLSSACPFIAIGLFAAIYAVAKDSRKPKEA